MDLFVHCRGHGAGERDVLVDCVHEQCADLAIRRGVKLPDEPVVMEGAVARLPPRQFRVGVTLSLITKTVDQYRQDGTVYLVDMEGTVAHTWRLPYRPGLYGHLLDNGHLFYGGKVMEDLTRFEAWPRFKGGAVLEVDWHGRVLWEVRHPDHHHDRQTSLVELELSGGMVK